ncbi:S8 family serine peptidase [Glycomyces sp. A-F 0318]|uniref:S8 family peptidase n=1 Tax=Glycomyces amatae TaxID=2881355 RepID=UPI001E42D074|nr:S8 family serine peptidase [Glycomyces amatae]MCD0445562.1 S8 family serine peptidase [Glycomyces amatae]
MWDRSVRRLLACVCAMLLALLAPASAGRAAAPAAWHLSAVGAPAAWSEAAGAGVVVAVVDSGVDADHPDLAGAVLPGRSYVDVDPGAEPRLLALGAEPGPVYERAFGQADPVGHGTAVAGIIAGRADSPEPGVAPEASILPVRVLDDENRYHDSAMVGAAVEWAVDNGADIVNLSLGGHYDSAPFAEALAYAERHDVLVVACTGNQHQDGPDEAVWFPARLPDVLAVTGTDRSGERWRTAVTGGETDLAAPGAELLAARSGGGHRTVTGTSFAAAVVSGAAALVRSAHPDWTAEQVRRALTATARPGGGGLGAGVVDAAAAVAADAEGLPPAADDREVPQAWSLAATAAGGGLLGLSALLLRGGVRPRGTEGAPQAVLPNPRRSLSGPLARSLRCQGRRIQHRYSKALPPCERTNGLGYRHTGSSEAPPSRPRTMAG